MTVFANALSVIARLVALLGQWLTARQKTRDLQNGQKARDLDRLRKAIRARRDAGVDSGGLPNDRYRRD